MNYIDQLKNPKWQKKRLEVFSRDNFSCAHCSNEEETLHVHHKKYLKNKMAWESPLEDLVTVCESCHKKLHSPGQLQSIEEMWIEAEIELRQSSLDEIKSMVKNADGDWEY